MKFTGKFICKEKEVKAWHIARQWVSFFIGDKTHGKKVFFEENGTKYHIHFFNTDGKITVELSIPRGKLMANEGDWIVNEINNKFSVYSNEEFIKLTYNHHAQKNKN